MIIIFHIGLHKTGSTFFQKEIFPKLNLNYVDFTDFKYFNRLIFDDVLYFKKFKLKSGLYSSEHLSGWIEERVINRKDILDKLYLIQKKSKIILFIRKQDSLAKSMYLQTIKTGSTLSLKSFYNLNNRRDSRKFLFLIYLIFII
ncbi:MAG: hypothetical protein PHR26_04060 [Candidatus ainarchaeum sp.]|nr:hypothetical protein [Candidatus ainarchaeum sp.]MDD3975600.1 hypothetical protein [Candidatus ainarchaeum sp.]